MKSIFLFLFTLMSVTFHSAVGHADTAVRVGVYNNRPLIFFDEKEQPRGFFADIIEHIADQEAWRIEYVHGTFAECLSMLQSGEIDILCTIAYTAERSRQFDFTRENLLTNWGQVYTPRDSGIQSIVDLNAKRVAVLKGDIHYEAFKKLTTDFGVNCRFVEVNDYKAVLQSIDRKDADAGIGNRFFGMQFGSNHKIAKSGVVFNPIKIHFAAPKDSSAKLLAAIDRHLAQLKKDDRSLYFQSLNKWIGGITISRRLPKWAPLAFWMTLILLLVLISGNLILRNQIKKQTKDLTSELALRKTIEDDLRATEERWQFALKGVGDGVWDWDIGTDQVHYSEQAKAVLGIEDDEAGNTMEAWRSRIHPDDCVQVFADLKKHLEGEYPSYQSEHRLKANDGSHKWILTRGKVIKWNTDGSPARVIGTHSDITDRMGAEKALRESEERLKAILQANPDPMVIYDTAGYPEYINPAFTQIFGWTLEEVKGSRIPFVPETQREITSQQIKEIYQSEKPVLFETQRMTKGGRILSVIVSAALIKEIDAKAPFGMIVNLTDITERKLLEAQYEQAQRMESIGTLAGGIAHDFNNLLMGIQGRVSLMHVDLEANHPHHRHIKEIGEYVRSAADLTKQLLGFARGGKYEAKPLDVNDLVKYSSDMFRRTRKEIAIANRLASELPAVEADRRQIEHVLLNIYVNAWQAMPGGGSLTIETRRVILDEQISRSRHVEPGEFVKISISDTGTGIAEALQHRIFDPFFTTKEKDRGTGLGLASAYGIIRNHGGFISVYSKVGQGTTFNLYLPATDKRPHAIKTPANEPMSGSETILLVDDEEMIIDVGQAMLDKLGYTTLVSRSGREAIEIVRSGQWSIDLVILDLVMPELDGGATFDQIRLIAPDMLILLSSGYAINGQAEAILQRGCNGFIQKPFNIFELSKKLRDILDLHLTAQD